jgi:uncharacterized protein (UPF0248 family)
MPMRTAIDVIRRAQHDRALGTERLFIGYVDRLVPSGMREQGLNAFKWEDLSALDDKVDLAIPQHRILYIRHADLGVVWDKRSRTDRIFGSTGNATVMAELRAAEAESEAEREAEREAEAVQEAAVVVEVAGAPAIQSARTRSGGQVRPNAFFSVEVRSRKVCDAARAVQAAFVARDPRLSEAVNPANALHVTLAVTRLDGAEDQQKALDLLERLAPRMHELVPPEAPLVVRGVRSFRDRVLYAAVEPHAGLDTFDGELRASLAAAGLLNGDH